MQTSNIFFENSKVVRNIIFLFNFVIELTYWLSSRKRYIVQAEGTYTRQSQGPGIEEQITLSQQGFIAIQVNLAVVLLLVFSYNLFAICRTRGWMPQARAQARFQAYGAHVICRSQRTYKGSSTSYVLAFQIRQFYDQCFVPSLFTVRDTIKEAHFYKSTSSSKALSIIAIDMPLSLGSQLTIQKRNISILYYTNSEKVLRSI